MNKIKISTYKISESKKLGSEKRSERKKKLKRVLDYDAETNLLDAFYKLKFKNMTIDEFEKLTKSSLVDTNIVSDVVFELYVEELRIKEEIKNKKILLEKSKRETKIIEEQISELESQLSSDDDVIDDDLLVDVNDFLGLDDVKLW